MKNTNKDYKGDITMNKKSQKILLSVMAAAGTLFFSTTAYATNLDPLAAINNLTTFVLNLVSGIGVIALIWGGVQLALALKSQDQSQKTQAILFLAGGAIMVGIKFVLQAIGVAV